jgi:hypothetical protein
MHRVAASCAFSIRREQPIILKEGMSMNHIDMTAGVAEQQIAGFALMHPHPARVKSSHMRLRVTQDVYTLQPLMLRAAARCVGGHHPNIMPEITQEQGLIKRQATSAADLIGMIAGTDDDSLRRARHLLHPS